MPLYYYACSSCQKEQRKILTPEAAEEPQACKSCGAKLTRTPRPPTSRVTEVLDNGVMTKSIERLADAERLFRDRNEVVRREQMGDPGEE